MPNFRILGSIIIKKVKNFPRTIVSQDVLSRFSVQMAFATFLSKINGNF